MAHKTVVHGFRLGLGLLGVVFCALLTKLFSSLGGMTQKASQAASQGDVTGLVTELLGAGMPANTIRDVLASDATGAAHDINSIFGYGEALY